MARIVAIVSIHPDHISGGGVPVFIENNTEEQQNVAFSLEKILDATANDLKNGTIILVEHSS